MDLRARKGRVKLFYPTQTKNCPTSFVQKNCTLDILTTCSLCTYSKGILLVCVPKTHFKPIRPIQFPDMPVKISQLSPFLNKLGGGGGGAEKEDSTPNMADFGVREKG